MECQSRATLHQVPHPALEANCSCLHLIACRSAGYRHAKLVSMAGAEQGGFPLHVAPFQYGLQVKANKTMLEWSGNGAQLLPSRCSNALLCPTQTWIPSSKGKSFSPGRIRYAIGPRSVPGAPTMAIPRRSASWCNALPPHLAAHAFFRSQVSQHIGDQGAWDYANVFWSRGMVVRSDVVFSPAARTHQDYVRLADTCSLFNLRVLQSGVKKWTKYVLEAAEKYKQTNAQAKSHPVRRKSHRVRTHAAI